MRNLGNQHKWRSIMQSRPFLIALLVLVLIFAWSVLGFWIKMRETGKNRRIIEAKVVELRQEKERLSADIAKLSTQAGVEDSIREKFGLAKEGEELIVVVDDESKTDTEEEENSNWLTSFFKKLFR